MVTTDDVDTDETGIEIAASDRDTPLLLHDTSHARATNRVCDL